LSRSSPIAKLLPRELRGTETNLERIRLAAFSRTLSRLGLQDDDLAEQMNAYYLQHRFDNVELFPEVVDALAVLSRSYVLGLLSNGNGYPERSGLAGTFAAVVFSQDHGVEKPDRRLFDVAAAEVGCEPGRSRHASHPQVLPGERARPVSRQVQKNEPLTCDDALRLFPLP